jgi:hypothetical protein
MNFLEKRKNHVNKKKHRVKKCINNGNKKNEKKGTENEVKSKMRSKNMLNGETEVKSK